MASFKTLTGLCITNALLLWIKEVTWLKACTLYAHYCACLHGSHTSDCNINMVQEGVSVGDLKHSSTCVTSEELHTYEVTPQSIVRKNCPDFILTFTVCFFLQEKSFYLANLENLWFMYKCRFFTWGIRSFCKEMKDADKSLLNNSKMLQKFHLLVKLVIITQKCSHTRRQNMESLRE